MKRICVYGKGGIGKSTAVSNLAAAMAQAGKRVAVVGCDPKADSTRGLMGRRIPTVLDQLKTGATTFEDLDNLKELGNGKIDFTIGSALDIFGGNMNFEKVAAYGK